MGTWSAASGGSEADNAVLDVETVAGGELEAAAAVPLTGARPVLALRGMLKCLYKVQIVQFLPIFSIAAQ